MEMTSPKVLTVIAAISAGIGIALTKLLPFLKGSNYVTWRELKPTLNNIETRLGEGREDRQKIFEELSKISKSVSRLEGAHDK